jgi:VWFA-related protein
MRMGKQQRLLVGPLVLAVLVVGGWFQAQAPSAQDVPTATIRVSTHLVLVDVVVTDKQGKKITGLKPEDFSLQEKGKAQKIVFFTPPADGAQAAIPEMPPGIYSNRPDVRTTGGPLTIMLLDAANTPFVDQAYARQQMLNYVRDQMKPGERIGIFALTSSLRVLQDFTSDPQILLKTLQRYKPQEPALSGSAPSSPVAAPEVLGSGAAFQASMVQNEVNSFVTAQVAYVLERRTEETLGAMRSLARILGGVPGRKNVLWLTAAFPFDLIPEDRTISEAELLDSLPSVKQKSVGTITAGSGAGAARQQHTEEIRQVAAQLASAQIALYPVDVRGLISGMEFQSEDSSSRQSVDSSGRAISRMSDASANQETMRALATETGGKAYVNQNEIKESVSLAMNDNSASYTLGYYPEDKKWDGKYRSIKVKLNHEGAEVRHRRGYFAIDPVQLKDRKPEQEVLEALGDNAPDTLVTFRAQVKPTDKGKIGVDFLVDANALSTEDTSGGGKKLNVVLYAAVYSPQGKMIDNRSTTVAQSFDANTYQQIVQHGMLVHMDLDPVPGKNQLRLAVRDNRTGYIGTIEAPLGQ